MAKAKQYVFSARVTQEGLKALNEVKAKLNIGWDELVIDAISAHYQLDKAMMTLPKKEATTNETPANEQLPIEATEPEQPAPSEHERPIEEKQPAKKRKKGKGKRASKPEAAA